MSTSSFLAHGSRLGLLAALLLFASCKKVSGPERVKHQPEQTPSGEKTSGGENQVPALEITPESLASIVRVRVAERGGTLRDHTGAVLWSGEASSELRNGEHERVVISMFPGYTEEQLKEGISKISIYRNKVNQGGGGLAKEFQARLVRFDQGTGLALLSYTEQFTYDMPVGLRIERSAISNATLAVLGTAPEAGETKEGPAATTLPFLVKQGRYEIQSSGQGVFAPPTMNPNEVPDIAPLAMLAPDKLVGFVGGDLRSSSLTSVSAFKIAAPSISIEPGGVRFTRVSGGTGSKDSETLVVVSTHIPPGENDQWRVRALFKEAPARPLAELIQSAPDGSFEPIQPEEFDKLPKTGPGPAEFFLSLPIPKADGEEKHYLVQLIWWRSGIPQAPRTYGKPFKVTLRREAEGVHPGVEGVAMTDEPVKQVAVEGEKFTLESPARSIHPILEGRELLFELERAPFWKRFSLEKREWLPLPVGELGNVRIAGNRDALFVLDRSSGEIRKYALADFKLLVSEKLPVGRDYVAVLAGCNSAHAPIHVLHTSGTLALSPIDLKRQDMPSSKERTSDGRGKSFSHDDWFSAYGDGMSFLSSKGFFHYQNDASGIVHQLYFGQNYRASSHTAGVSAAYLVGDEMICFAAPEGRAAATRVWQHGQDITMTSLAANCPVIFRLSLGDTGQVPPRPARLACLSIFDSTPFSEVDVPELSNVEPSDRERLNTCRWAVFDPYSLSLGTLDRERSTFTVRQLAAPPEDRQPILLNWPDTSLVRGKPFQFQPLISGKNRTFSSQITGRPDAVTVAPETGMIQAAVASDEKASLQVMTLSIPKKEGDGGLTYYIPLHLAGTRLPLAALPESKAEEVNQAGQDFSSLVADRNGIKALSTHVHTSREPIEDIVGPISGHLALILASDRVEFYSQESKAIVGSIAKSAGSLYYGGADALFEYEPAKKSLCRISVPEGKREHVFSLPPHLELRGIGVGIERTSPVTLVVENTKELSSTRIGNTVLTLRPTERAALILDSRTLQADTWAQPAVQQEKGASATRNLFAEPYHFSVSRNEPVQLPTSHNGRVVIFPNSFLLLAAQVSLVCPYDKGPSVDNLHQRMQLFLGGTSHRMAGSLTGLIAGTPSGKVYRGGATIPLDKRTVLSTPKGVAFTACGRYRLTAYGSGDARYHYIEVRTTDTDKPLLKIAGLEALANEEIFTGGIPKRRIIPIGDGGDFALLSPSGDTMQLVYMSIPEVTRQMSPEDLHVISQPQFYVAEGYAMEYQLQVNNPQAVARVQLQSPVPGASLSSSGRFRFTAPRGVREPIRVDISIEISRRDGRKTLQQFPIFIFSVPKPAGIRAAAR